VRGLTSLRGQIVTAIDLRRRLGWLNSPTAAYERGPAGRPGSGSVAPPRSPAGGLLLDMDRALSLAGDTQN